LHGHCLSFIVSLLFSGDNYYLYTLNIAVLLPLWAVTGYYIIKKSRSFIEEERPQKNLFFTKKDYFHFLFHIKNVLFRYILSVSIFAILQNVLFYKSAKDEWKVKIAIWILIILIPLIVSTIAGMNFDKGQGFIIRVKKWYRDFNRWLKNNKVGSINYLTHFIIALLLAVILISLIPTITFINYGFYQEKKLQVESYQIDLAKKIQTRRNYVNAKLWQTKLRADEKAANYFQYALKFSKDKGIYLLGDDDSLDSLNTKFFNSDSSKNNFISTSFYKIVTQFLFLPPDHDEFFDNPTHNSYYYWNEPDENNKKNILQLYYKNTTDYRNPSSFYLTSKYSDSYLGKGFTQNYIGLLILLAILIFIISFYRLIYSVSKRIFLLGFFNKSHDETKKKDPDWLKRKLDCADLSDLGFPPFLLKKPISFKEIRAKENELLKNKNGEEEILQICMTLLPVYERIWEECNDAERYTLYDFAKDGFTNYKKQIILHELYKKGLLIKMKNDDSVTLMTPSFRNFLITKETSEDIKKSTQREGRSSWNTIRTTFYILLIVIALFIFVTQEETSKRLIAIITSLGALLPALLKLFDKSTSPSTKSGG